MTLTAPAIGGETLAQERRIVTSIPGPRSIELMERKKQAVPTAVGTTMPVFAAAE
jgi:4-aminobutyrate aminotransferase/(S)-3-amino-2-methylpropionate transaminase